MSETVKTGHPKGLWVLFGTEMWALIVTGKHKQRGKKTLLSLTLVRLCEIT